MREKLYLAAFLLGAGLLLYAGRGYFSRWALVAWALTFAGTTALGVLATTTLYRVQHELRASQRELARKEAELTFAREVQQALFPRHFPTDGGLEFAATCVPAAGVSGDYYDVLRLADGRVAFAIADISGKGISAAILMSSLHAVLRTLAAAGHTPCELGSQLNHHLHQVTDGTRFATLFYAEWIRTERTLRYINAGHNAPLLLGSKGVRRLAADGPPLGLFLRYNFRIGELELEPGDLMVLYSDGLTEAGVMKRGGEAFGESRLEAVVRANHRRPLPELQQHVLAAVRNWAGRDLHDDMTLVLVRTALSVPGARALAEPLEAQP